MIWLTHYRTACTRETQLLDDIPFPQRVHWFPDTYERVGTGLRYVPHRLAEKVLDPELCALLRDTRHVGKTAFLLAAGNAHFAGIGPRKYDTQLSYTYRFLPYTLTQVYAGRTAQSVGATDYIATDSTACASSLKALMDVQTLITLYRFDRVVVLSLEDAVSNAVLDFFGESRASLTAAQQEGGQLPSAFDSTNGGFHVGQGAVLAVFESTEGMMRSGSHPIARLMGAYTAGEACTNPIGQNESGEGYVRAIAGALDFARVTGEDIDVVKTHGTGTQSNNLAEYTAINSTVTGFVATSYKPSVGHTMGASGLLETCLLLDDMRSGFVPAIANRTQHDDTYLSDPVPSEGMSTVLSLAAGMGNVYSAAVLSLEV